ncbi:MAG TPA: hypothetical protein VJG83_01460 [archaeon]|nr:hypothetical protein [archaeon]
MKPVKVILSPEAEQVYKYLANEAAKSKIEKSILNAINKKSELIKQNPHYGNPISHELIPKEYIQKYGITNLFRVELPNYWRMFYTLTNNAGKIEIIAFILEISDHPTYDKRMKYKKR